MQRENVIVHFYLNFVSCNNKICKEITLYNLTYHVKPLYCTYIFFFFIIASNLYNYLLLITTGKINNRKWVINMWINTKCLLNKILWISNGIWKIIITYLLILTFTIIFSNKLQICELNLKIILFIFIIILIIYFIDITDLSLGSYHNNFFNIKIQTISTF